MSDYDHPVEEEHGDLMSVEQFKASVKAGLFIDYDGFGYPVKDGKAATKTEVRPSKAHLIPEDATHVIWFNR